MAATFETIHNAQAGEIHIRLVERTADYVIVVDDGGKFAAIDPRGNDRKHAVFCFTRAVELAPQLLEAILDSEKDC